jgi:hypothetical protein
MGIRVAKKSASKVLFSNVEAIRFGWEQTKQNLGFLLGMLLVGFLITEIPEVLVWLVNWVFGEESLAGRFLALILTLLGVVLSIVIGMGQVIIFLKILRRQKKSIGDLVTNGQRFWPYLGGTLLYGIVVIGGLVLLVVPGIIWSIMFRYTPLLILDKKMGPIKALEKSSQMTRGLKWKLFRLDLRTIGVFLLGLLCLVVGLIPAYTTTIMAHLSVYEKLLKRKG